MFSDGTAHIVPGSPAAGPALRPKPVFGPKLVPSRVVATGLGVVAVSFEVFVATPVGAHLRILRRWRLGGGIGLHSDVVLVHVEGVLVHVGSS